MEERPRAKGWWQSVPGILTAAAGIITAVTGLIVALNQAGVFDRSDKRPPPVGTDAAKPPTGVESPSAPPKQNAGSAPGAEASRTSRRINLLAAENGGHLVVASSEDWMATIDGREDFAQIGYGLGREAVYAFKDQRPATFDTFAMLIPGTETNNVKEFELLVANDSPTGSFDSLGKFQTQNVRLFKTPYQEFRVPAVKARYLKFKLISTYGWPHPGVYEFQLFGRLEGG